MPFFSGFTNGSAGSGVGVGPNQRCKMNDRASEAQADGRIPGVDDGRTAIGIIGLGGFGHFLLEQWSKLKEIRIVAASDEDPSRSPVQVDGLRFYTDYRELLDDPIVEIVSIATPPSTHLPMALAAIEKGKHVLIEKPVALSAADGRRIADAARSSGVVATVNFMLRFDPLVEGLRKIVAAGVFGRPRRADLRNYATQDTVPPGHWFWDRRVSGGILIEHGVHFFDMTSWILGSSAREATGLSVWRNPEQEDRMFAAVRYQNDVIGTYWHSFTRPMALETTTFHMAFDLGEFEVAGWIPLTASFWGWTDASGVAALYEHLPGIELFVEELSPFETRSSNLVYRITASVRGRAELNQPKTEVYGDLLRAMLLDVVAAVRDPSHELRVTLEDAVAALTIAEQATDAAHRGMGAGASGR